MLDVPLLPSDVAVMVAEPTAAPVTNPLPSTVATDGLSVDQVITRPDNGLPFASLGVAVSCTVSPTATLAGDGVTVTDATGASHPATADVALRPSPAGGLVAGTAATPQ